LSESVAGVAAGGLICVIGGSYQMRGLP
jgi:hypothetical protein